MAIRLLHLLGSPVLRQQSPRVGRVDAEVRRLVDDLWETMEAARGIGLAANQVGVAQRVAVVGAGDERFAMIDPVVLARDGRDVHEEGCLSLPELYADVTRPERITLEALDEHGTLVRRELAGIAARCALHELDHLDGILFTDHLGPLKRQMLLKRFRKEHDGKGYLKDVRDMAPEGMGTG